jgi:predicted ATPase
VQTNWYVITGGPSSGKTTVVELLAKQGYHTTIEEARHYIDLQNALGISTEAAKENARVFQENILTLQIALEAGLDPNETIFLDRAIPDDLAYFHYLGLEPDRRLIEASSSTRYKKVFLLDLLPLHHDYARTEDLIAQRAIHELICDVYEARSEPVIRVPVLSPKDRMSFILENL